MTDKYTSQIKRKYRVIIQAKTPTGDVHATFDQKALNSDHAVSLTLNSLNSKLWILVSVEELL